MAKTTDVITMFVELKVISPQGSITRINRPRVVLGRVLKTRPNDPRGTVVEVKLRVNVEEFMPKAEAFIGGLNADVIVEALAELEADESP